MKKKIAVVLAVLLGISMTACTKKDDTQPHEEWLRSALTQIYSMEEGGITGVNRTNMLSLSPTHSKEFPEGTTRTFQTDSRELELIYEETLYYPASDEKHHVYRVVGTEEGRIHLCEDGTMSKIIGDVLVPLPVSKTDSAEKVQAVAEAVLSDLIDFSLYENVQVTPETPGDDFVSYIFRFSNTTNGYTADTAYLVVRSDGMVTSLGKKVLKSGVSDVCNNIDQDLEKELIVAKLKEIYNTEKIEYREDLDIYHKSVTVRDEEVQILYRLGFRVYDDLLESEYGVADILLIPVKLMIKGQNSESISTE